VLHDREIPYGREVELTIHYKARLMRQKYRADFVCFDDIVVDLKALNCLGGAEDAQMINYLKVSKKKVGLLLNFGGEKLEFKRFVN
jgi:GxxExxY protein